MRKIGSLYNSGLGFGRVMRNFGVRAACKEKPHVCARCRQTFVRHDGSKDEGKNGSDEGNKCRLHLQKRHVPQEDAISASLLVQLAYIRLWQMSTRRQHA